MYKNKNLATIKNKIPTLNFQQLTLTFFYFNSKIHFTISTTYN